MKAETTGACNVHVSNILQFVPFGSTDLQELYGSQQKNVSFGFHMRNRID